MSSHHRTSVARWGLLPLLPAVLLLGARHGRYAKDGRIAAHPPSNIPFLALGAWVLAVGWFGFNVMSAQTLDKISGLVAVNSLMAMVGGTLAAWMAGRNDLEPAAREIVPAIGDILDWMREQNGVTLARMSGSGATCFALFDDDAARDSAAAACPSNWWHLATNLR